MKRRVTVAYVVGGGLVVLLAVAAAVSLGRHTIENFALLMSAVSQFVRAAAWPALVLFVLLRYPLQLGRLIDRLRKFFGHEFDPVAAQEGPAPLGTYTAAALGHVRTPAVIEMEEVIRGLPVVAAGANAEAKAEVLATIAARIFLVLQYEQIESGIWASQLRLLEALNANPGGLALDAVTRDFFDPAAAAFPETVGRDTATRWLGFLLQALVVRPDTGRVLITTRGGDYLTWRSQQRKPQKVLL